MQLSPQATVKRRNVNSPSRVKDALETARLKEFADRQVREDQWKKRCLWKVRVEEGQQFTRSDEVRDE
jgi:hypothetical protein